MKFVLFGSDLCGDCVEFKQILKDRNVDYDYQNITKELSALKGFLKIRDSQPEYVEIKKNGGIGIPCLVVDGTKLVFTPEQLEEVI